MNLQIEILHKGILSSIQDRGRFGYKHLAIPQSGWMDHHSAKLANLLVGNALDAPNIEMTLQSAKIYFHQDGIIAITGADMSFQLNGISVPLNRAITVKSGSTLTGAYAKQGLRSYLGIAGTYTNLKSDYNSYSTFPTINFGGITGQYLKNGDQLYIQQKKKMLIEIEMETTLLDAGTLNVSRGPEFDMLDNESKQILLESTFKISPDFGRMGARLEGSTPLKTTDNLYSSVPVLPGTIQCLPNGQLVVILQDGQTTGGYPRIGLLEQEALNVFNQIRPGLDFSFYI